MNIENKSEYCEKCEGINIEDLLVKLERFNVRSYSIISFSKRVDIFRFSSDGVEENQHEEIKNIVEEHLKGFKHVKTTTIVPCLCGKFRGEKGVCYECSGTIREYHDSNIEEIYGAESGNCLGFELEVLIPENIKKVAFEMDNKIENIHFEEDSSIESRNGVEIITNYGDFNQIIDIADEVSEYFDKFEINKNCGLHVHLTKKSPFSEAKMVCFWNMRENQEFLFKFTRRISDEYAYVDFNKKSNSEKESLEILEKNNYSHYSVVNTSNIWTTEVRGFASTNCKLTLLACIELAYLSYEYCRVADIEDLNIPKFLEWASDKQLYIHDYLDMMS